MHKTKPIYVYACTYELGHVSYSIYFPTETKDSFIYMEGRRALYLNIKFKEKTTQQDI